MARTYVAFVLFLLWIPVLAGAQPGSDAMQGPPLRAACSAAARTALKNDYKVDRASKELELLRHGVRLGYRNEEDVLEAAFQFEFARCVREQGLRQFDGFFLAPPHGDGWQLTSLRTVPVAFSSGWLGRVGYTKRLDGAAPAGAGADLLRMMLPRDQDAALAALTKRIQDRWNDLAPGHTLLSLDITPTVWDGATCVRYATRVAVSNPPRQRFNLVDRHLACIQPDRWNAERLPSLVVDVSYRERFEGDEPSPTFENDAGQFLGTLVFRPLNPAFYVLGSLQQYAALLRELGDDAQAKEIDARAAAYHAFHEGTGYAFRNEDEARLRDYAGLLRQQNRSEEAVEIEALAQAAFRSTAEQFLEQFEAASPTGAVRAEGISVIPPAGQEWGEDISTHRCQPPGPTRGVMLFRRKTTPPHSVVASVDRTALSTDVASHLVTQAERDSLLYKVGNEKKSLWASGRYTVISFAGTLDHSLGYDCLRTDALTEDRGVPGQSGKVFEFEQHAYHCLAPDHRSVVMIEYSQRAPKGAQTYDLRAEGEAFLKTLHFASENEPQGPPRPLNDRLGASLDEYARRLRASGNPTKANEVANQAERMREAERQMCAGTPSVALGFVPDKTLFEYADFLRITGCTNEAIEAEALSKEYRDIQLSGFLRQQQQLQRKQPR